MSVLAFDHYNLSAHRADLERLKAFYVDVVGLREGARPPIDRFGYWLYAGDVAVLHLIEARPGERRDADVAGSFNHVAFRCTGHATVVARLTARGIPVRAVEDRAQGSRQLFIRDPLGNGVELTFAGGEGS